MVNISLRMFCDRLDNKDFSAARLADALSA
jgi:hypothetical protein